VQKGDKQNVIFPPSRYNGKLTILILKIRILRLFQKWWRASYRPITVAAATTRRKPHPRNGEWWIPNLEQISSQQVQNPTNYFAMRQLMMQFFSRICDDIEVHLETIVNPLFFLEKCCFVAGHFLFCCSQTSCCKWLRLRINQAIKRFVVNCFCYTMHHQLFWPPRPTGCGFHKRFFYSITLRTFSSI